MYFLFFKPTIPRIMHFKSKCISTLMLLLLMLVQSQPSYCRQYEEKFMNTHVTFSGEVQTIIKIEKEIKRQTGFSMQYANEFLDPNELFFAKATDEPLESFLKKLLAGRDLQWRLSGLIIVIESIGDPGKSRLKTADSLRRLPERRTLAGTVKGKNGMPLPGASVRVDDTNDKCIVDLFGNFKIYTFHRQPVLIVSYTGYKTDKFNVGARQKCNVVLKELNFNLDETIIIAYGTSSKRLSTGTVDVVKSDRIQQNLSSNPFLSLQGAVPGLLTTQSGGAPGASLDIQIHGQNSFQNGSAPLIILDEVPLAANNDLINTLTAIFSQNTNAGVTPLTSINGAEIESFEILKGADATSIYGSRGANGVIFVTTKKATPGVRKFTFQYSSGSSSVGYLPRVLSTSQYLSMRREAFENDGVTANADKGTIGFAPDLTIWDTTRNTNWPRKIIGGHAGISDVYASYSDGTTPNKILIGCGMYTESTVLPGDFGFWKGTFNSSYSHMSADSVFKLSLSGNYSQDKNNTCDATLKSLYLPPNAPAEYKDNRELNWSEKGASYENPFADFLKKYSMSKENQLMNMKMAYKVIRGLTFNAGFGYNKMSVDEHSTFPIAAQNPALLYTRTGKASFASAIFKSFIIEPTAEYKLSSADHHFIFLLGGSSQSTDIQKSHTAAEGYTSDTQLETTTAATSFSIHTSGREEYKYNAVFGRITYNYKNKYLLNLSVRRDGSSRFSPESKFHNLWSVGAAYIFTEDSMIMVKLPFLSFGKFRGSYGITGNDQIGNYKYLNTRSQGGGLPYDGISALIPDALYNKDFYWEKCSKLELSADLYFFENRLMTTFSFFRNISSQQILERTLPSQTGFSSILQNYNARILNRNWEFTLSANVINSKNTSLTFGFNFTLPVNRLLEFDNLIGSVYEGRYLEGASLKVLYRVRSKGVDPLTGKYSLIEKDGRTGFTIYDCFNIGKLDPIAYGGITGQFRYRSFEVQASGEFRRTMAPGYLSSMYLNNFVPGRMNNQDPMVLDHWMTAGDNAQFARYSAISSSDVNGQVNDVLFSEQAYVDVAYFRLRTASVSYNFSRALLSRFHLSNASIFCKGQNLFTITNYKGGDPETSYSLSIPVLRVFSVGLKLQL